MTDRIFEGWLQNQLEEGLALAASSDLVQLFPLSGDPPHKYLVELRCNGLVERDGQVVEASRFTAGIWFPPDYKRQVDPYQIVTLLEPVNLWHPNYDPKQRVICVGNIPPGTTLTSLIYQLFEIITYQRVTMKEDDALNWAACAWARNHTNRFPIDARPLKRLDPEIRVDMAEASTSHD